MLSSNDRREDRIKAEAKRLGFSLVGIAAATEADGFDRYAKWLEHGYHGAMGYLEEYRDERRHPESVFVGVRSVVMVGMEYRGLTRGRIAAYAQGPDYHRFVWDRLNELSAWLQQTYPEARSHGVCDTAPLLERDFARRAGLGWVGKNAMLIDKHRGSFFFLGAFLTNLVLEPDAPHAANHCGTCTKCLDACPTDAFPAPGVVDARKCISYLTIELRSAIPDALREGIGGWLYGCDVCQDVCPWNRNAVGQAVPFPADVALATLDPIELLGISEAEFRRRFRGTVFFRIRRAGLLRNAAIVLGNTGDASALPALEAALRDKEALIREAAAWAIQRISSR